MKNRHAADRAAARDKAQLEEIQALIRLTPPK